MTDVCGVYAIRCIPSGMVYVGSSLHIGLRWANHRSLLARGCHHSAGLQADWQKYGPEAFAFGVLEIVIVPPFQALAEAEWRHIRELGADQPDHGYNTGSANRNLDLRPPTLLPEPSRLAPNDEPDDELAFTWAPSAAAPGVGSAALLLEVMPLAMRTIRTRMRANRAADVSVPQFRALGYANRHPGASLTSVAEHLGLTLPATSRLVDGLARRGYLQREASASDRRSLELRIAPKGAEMLEMTRRSALEHLSGRMEELTPGERETVGRALELLRGVFGSAHDLPAASERDGAGATRNETGKGGS